MRVLSVLVATSSVAFHLVSLLQRQWMLCVVASAVASSIDYNTIEQSQPQDIRVKNKKVVAMRLSGMNEGTVQERTLKNDRTKQQIFNEKITSRTPKRKGGKGVSRPQQVGVVSSSSAGTIFSHTASLRTNQAPETTVSATDGASTSTTKVVQSPAAVSETVSTCQSEAAQIIRAAVPEAITFNPEQCCTFTGPIAVFATHSEANNATGTGFDIFWDTVAMTITATSELAGVCFVMTGYDQYYPSTKTLSEILQEVLLVSVSIPSVQAIMATDPTSNIDLVQVIRTLSDDPGNPSIGIWNAGYDNIVTEALLTGMRPLPFIGYKDDTAFGSESARVTLEFLGNTSPIPRCLNARPDISFVGERCVTYYNDLVSGNVPDPSTGVVCSVETSANEVLDLITVNNLNAILAHSDCCTAAGQAKSMAETLGLIVYVGCTDEDTSGGLVDYVTEQPIEQEAYQTSSWANFPVLHDSRQAQFFPSLQSLVNTAIFVQLIQ